AGATISPFFSSQRMASSALRAIRRVEASSPRRPQGWADGTSRWSFMRSWVRWVAIGSRSRAEGADRAAATCDEEARGAAGQHREGARTEARVGDRDRSPGRHDTDLARRPREAEAPLAVGDQRRAHARLDALEELGHATVAEKGHGLERAAAHDHPVRVETEE